jgi:cytochrome b subunit of formate dehydrogenase
MKSTILKAFSNYSRWTTFHICMVATLLTGFLMAASAEELGAVGPMLVSLGVCAMLFAIIGELLFLIRVFARWAARKLFNTPAR